jgi:type VII secretion-associated protein (TIGR03931 family)
VTACVVEVGPGTIRGPCDVAQHLVSTALECIDDEIAFLDEQPVGVAAVWREVFRSVLPGCVETAVLVCPTWWPSPRVERVQEAAAATSTNIVVLQRTQVLADSAPGTPTVVEIAPEFVAVSRAGCVLMAEPRLGDSVEVARTVADGVDATSAVLVDAPVGVDGALALAGAIVACLRTRRVAVTMVHQDRVLSAVRDRPTPPTRSIESPRRRWPGVAVLAAVAASVALLCVGVAVESDVNGPPSTEIPMTLLVEGRVAAKVPAQWVVRRITSGPGSARVQVMAPDGATAVLITQSQVREGESMSGTVATLRRALDDQEAGVFVQFNPDDRRADRPAATYRELRDGRQIDWAVFVDDTVRIAIGCQSAPGSEDAVRYVCEEAIRSAHAVI